MANALPSNRVVALIVVIGVYALLTSAGIVHPSARSLPPDRHPMPLRYGPSWLPDGLVEVGRDYDSGERMWAPAGTVSLARLRMHVWPYYVDRDPRRPPDTPQICWGFTGLTQAEPVDVNGRPGHYGDRASWGKPAVCWRSDDSTLITVVDDGLGLSRADLTRIAASVRRDARWTAFPVRVPPDADEQILGTSAPRSMTVSGSSPTNWTAKAVWHPHSKGGRDVTVTARPGTATPTSGERLTVAGHRAWYVNVDGTSYLVVDFGGGVQLKVEVGNSSEDPGAPGPDALASAVEDARVDRSSLQWLGARGLVG
jgi:hypothetical protein